MGKSKSVQWSIIHRLDGDHLCIRMKNDEVIMVWKDCSVYYPFEEPIEPTQAPDVDVLASILIGIPRDTLTSISQFCAEPRTMAEIEEQYPGVEAWGLRNLGFLEDVGKRGRRIVSKWVGYDYEGLVDVIHDQYQRSKRQ